ncbi:hypothetical protein HAX54_030339, partial [Datura stramonium]|nr:hypothetical protein [Datura stramonium]
EKESIATCCENPALKDLMRQQVKAIIPMTHYWKGAVRPTTHHWKGTLRPAMYRHCPTLGCMLWRKKEQKRGPKLSCPTMGGMIDT